MEEKDLNIVTKEILLRTSYLKECIKKANTVGEDYIIRGIILFEEVLKSVNPIEINDEVIKKIQMCIDDILAKREILDHYYTLGINRCYFIIYDYKLVTKTKKLD